MTSLGAWQATIFVAGQRQVHVRGAATIVASLAQVATELTTLDSPASPLHVTHRVDGDPQAWEVLVRLLALDDVIDTQQDDAASEAICAHCRPCC